MSSRKSSNKKLGSSVTASPASAASEVGAKSSDTTPPSSPPSGSSARDKMAKGQGGDDTMDVDANPSTGVSATMEAEERRMQEASRKQDEARDLKMQKERQKDIDGGSEAMDSKFKALDYLLSQSKVTNLIDDNQRGEHNTDNNANSSIRQLCCSR